MSGEGYGGAPRGGGVPDWARFFESDQFGEFLSLVRRALVDEEADHDMDIEQGLVEVRPEDAGPRLLGLGNLAQACRQMDREEWPATIAGHIQQLLHMPDHDGELLEKFGEDFETAKPYLKVRLFAEGLPNEDLLVIRRPMEGVLKVLVYDLPDAIATVPREHVTNWGLFDDELFELALDQVRQEKPDREDVDIDEGGVKATLLAGPSYFSATHALLLDEYLTDKAAAGALVAIPHRHVVLFHEIVDQKVIPALNRMAHLAHAMHEEGPGSISPSVYWYDRTRFRRIPAKVEDGTIEIYPPKEFVEMLNGLVA
jgi:hypothetical protein